MKTCLDCGERVYNLGCVNCNESAYIEEQAMFDALNAPDGTWDGGDEDRHDCGEDSCCCADKS